MRGTTSVTIRRAASCLRPVTRITTTVPATTTKAATGTATTVTIPSRNFAVKVTSHPANNTTKGPSPSVGAPFPVIATTAFPSPSKKSNLNIRHKSALAIAVPYYNEEEDDDDGEGSVERIYNDERVTSLTPQASIPISFHNIIDAREFSEEILNNRDGEIRRMVPLSLLKAWSTYRSEEGSVYYCRLLLAAIEDAIALTSSDENGSYYQDQDQIVQSENVPSLHEIALQDGRDFGGNDFALNTAPLLLRRVLDLYSHIGTCTGISIPPTRKACNLTLDVLSNSNHPSAPRLIADVLNSTSSVQVFGSDDVSEQSTDPSSGITIGPDSIGLNSVLRTYQRRGKPQDCEDLMRSRPSLDSDHPARVDAISYNIVINAWAKSSAASGPERAEALLREMAEKGVMPGVVAFTTVADAWGRSTRKRFDSAERAEGVLRWMWEIHDNGGDGSEQGACCPTPNAVTYNVVLAAWGRSRVPGAAGKAEELLDEMLQLWHNDEHCEEQQSNEYSGVQGGSNRIRIGNGNKGKQQHQPGGKIAFTICITAWSKSDEVGSSLKAMALLGRMFDLAGARVGGKGGEKKSDTAASSIVEKIIAGSYNKDDNNSSSVDDIYYRNYSSRRPEFLPDTVTYNAALRCIANDSDTAGPGRARAAGAILNLMSSLDCQPDSATYNTVLRCCSTSRPRNKREEKQVEAEGMKKMGLGSSGEGGYAMHLALKVLVTMTSGNTVTDPLLKNSNPRRYSAKPVPALRPDAYTFNYFIKACDRLCREGTTTAAVTNGKANISNENINRQVSINHKLRMINVGVKTCIRMGAFGDPVIDLLKTVLKPKDLMKVLEISDNRSDPRAGKLRSLKSGDFPQEWSSAVVATTAKGRNGRWQQKSRKQQQNSSTGRSSRLPEKEILDTVGKKQQEASLEAVRQMMWS